VQKNAIKKQDGGAVNKKVLKMGDAPYLEYFGTQLYNTTENKALTIKNNTGSDIIVCLFNSKSFVRSCFIGDGYYAEIPQLPKKPIHVRYLTGTDWDFAYELKDAGLHGAFTKNLNFYKTISETELGPVNEITLVDGTNEGFEKINEKEFFTKN